jgi:hypothetical protein
MDYMLGLPSSKDGHDYVRKQVLDFHLQDVLFCYPGHLCVPSSECAKIIWEAHCSQVEGRFDVEKIVVVI